MAGLNVVALISGGKDSFFSLLHCQSNGHRIVALANLHPPELDSHGDRAEDLESYMYQTIGHAVIPQYETALGLPLYREEISGHAVNQKKNYGPSPLQRNPTDGETAKQDETESLVPLLKRVMAAHPEINAVSTGAIMSDYQRTRVESVALRLGLTPLSYLWQWPFLAGQTPDSLLRHMAAVGQDARIVKVASGGLDDAFLWQNVADSRTIHRLTAAARRFGTPDDGAVLGEGGEYETLAIAGPAPFWKGRIVVEQEAVEVVQGEAGSASVRIKASMVEPIEDDGTLHGEVSRPDVFDARFQSLLDGICSMVTGDNLSLSEEGFAQIPHEARSSSASIAADVGDAFVLQAATGSGSDIQEQTRSIMDNAMEQLSKRNLRSSDAVYTTIILRNMADFASVNKIYGSYFTDPNPPARLTIACADVLPTDAQLSISMTAAPGPREGLHVQSRSYWAPANIGPYSQAISFSEQTSSDATRSAVFVSGQIPLVPASMELLHTPGVSTITQFAHEAVLALQHLDRIGRRMDVRSWSYGLVFVTLPEEGDLKRRAAVTKKIWQSYHHRGATDTTDEETGGVDDEEFDVWHLKHGHSGSNSMSTVLGTDVRRVARSDGRVPPLTLAIVDSLPRGAGVEWVGFGTRAADGRPVESTPLHLTNLLESFSAQPGRLWSITVD